MRAWTVIRGDITKAQIQEQFVSIRVCLWLFGSCVSTCIQLYKRISFSILSVFVFHRLPMGLS